MKKETNNHVKLGIFVMLSFILFTIGIYQIGSKKHLFDTVIKVSAVFKNIKGLQNGSMVRYAGINVGSVSDISIVNDTTIQVDMRIKSDLQNYLKKNAEASIGSNGLVGDKVVNIQPSAFQGESGKLIESGDFIKTMEQVETDELVASLDQTSQNILLISENLVAITDKINQGEGLMANLISNKKLADNINGTIYHLKKTAYTLSTTTEEMEAMVKSMQAGEGMAGYLLKDTTLALKVEALFAKIDTQLIYKTSPILANLDSSSTNVKSLSFTIDSLIKTINLEEGMLGLLLKDSLSTKQTHEILDQTIIGVDKFNQNMEALKNNFLLRRYFKKQEKKKRKAAAEQQKNLLNKTESKTE